MRKFIVILAVLVTLLLVAAVTIPRIYKEDIQKAIRLALDENIDAKIYFDPADFGLTLFKNFPNPTASIEDLSIVGVDQFESDTLLSAGSFNLTIDLFSIFRETFTIKSINLVEPRIHVLVLENGRANYEIMVESEKDSSEYDESTTTDFSLSIDEWNISDGFFSYQDRSLDLMIVLEGLSHTGSGNLSLDVYDLATLSNIDHAMISYEGTRYINGHSLFANATLNIVMSEFKFTFKENLFRVNDFPFAVDGFIAMPEEDIELDISFASANSSIKSLYSLIPGTFTPGYENIEASGEMSFNGTVKGTYNANQMPAYAVALEAVDGMISYPELPLPIKNIDIAMKVECADGNVDNTRIEISKMHMDMGNNPFDATVLIRNLNDYSTKASIDARLDLAELAQIFPIDGLDMKGIFSMKLNADGIYDSIRSMIPAITAEMILKDGHVKSGEFPKALEDFSFSARLQCPTGKMEDFSLNVENFALALGEEDLSGNLLLTNLEDYTWDLDMKGDLDLEVISEVYPIEGMKYSGLLNADIETKGRYSDVEAGRYNKLPTVGQMKMRDFNFVSQELPQGMKINESSISINPRHLKIESFSGTVGRSDMRINGFIGNYIDYIFSEKGLLTGEMSLNSNLLDLNEWMTGVESATNADEDTTQLEILVLPQNIDFSFQSSIEHIYYDNLNLQNAKGLLTIKNGLLDMSDLSFNLLGGSVVMNGKYDTRIPDSPAFNYQLNVKTLSIPDAFTSFSTVRSFAPMAKLMTGDFSTNFSISGLLKQDMSPIYESLNGKGLILISEASMRESKLVSGISTFMKSSLDSEQLILKDVIMKTSVENGRAHVAPFDVTLGGQKANISGSIGADGTLDYYISTEVEAGAVGQQVNQLLAGLRGEDASTASSKIKLNFNVSGTYENPKILLAGTSSKDGTTTIQNQVVDGVKQEVNAGADSLMREAEHKVQDETTKLMEKGEAHLQQQLDTLKKGLTKDLEKEAADVLGKELDSTTNELKNSLQNLFKKKKKDKN